MTTFWVDVSHHDRDRRRKPLDWAAIRKVTSPAMCARATYGDPDGYNPSTRYFAEFQQGAKAAGFTLRGGYHNLIRGDAAGIARQVDYFRRELDALGCNWAMLDIERYPELVDNGLWPRWSDVERFRDRWGQVESRVLTYYLPKWLWADHLGSPDLRVLGGPLVASDYGDNDSLAPAPLYTSRGGDSGRGWTAYGHVTPAGWQFGSRCQVTGATGTTDINAHRGSIDQLAALLTGDDMSLTKDDINTLLKTPVFPYDAPTQSLGTTWLAGYQKAVTAEAEAKANGEALTKLDGKLDALSARVEAGVGAGVTDEQLERVLRRVIGSVDGASPATPE